MASATPRSPAPERKRQGGPFAFLFGLVSHGDRRWGRLARKAAQKKNLHKRAEDRALRARMALEAAIESMPEGFILFDAADKFILCNRKFRKIYTGVGELLAPDWHFADIVASFAALGNIPEAEGALEVWLEHRLDRHQNPGVDFEETLSDGRRFYVRERKTADGGTVCIYADITAQRKLQAELKDARDKAEMADRTKSKFLANMSHELRTPLNAIIGFSEVLTREMFGPLGNLQYRGYATDIHDSGVHLLHIVNDILDISRLESGNALVDEGEVDVRKLIGTSLRLVRQHADKFGLRLRIEASDTLPLLYADDRKVKQIIINLLNNAVKFTNPGGQVIVAAAIEADGGLALTVRDSGIGIAADDLAKVMRPFGQADSGTRQFEGTGLGLPIVDSLARVHGGCLDIQSMPGFGTTATVRFPAARVLDRWPNDDRQTAQRAS